MNIYEYILLSNLMVLLVETACTIANMIQVINKEARAT